LNDQIRESPIDRPGASPDTTANTPARTGVFRYGAAVLLVVAASLVGLYDLEFSRGTPFLLFYPVPLLAFLCGGLGPGLMAAALSTFAVHYLLLPPYYSLALHHSDFSRMALFFAIQIAQCLLLDSRDKALRRSDARLRSVNAHLEQRVGERTAQLQTTNTELLKEIAERKRAEESTRRYAEDLKRSNQELEHFAYVASHDLQEPLRTVSSFSQLLARRYQGRLDASADEFIDFIVGGATRMQTLIQDLLSFSRIGTRGSMFAPVDYEEVLQAATHNLGRAISESGAVITHDPLPTLRADRAQSTQLLQNLFSNAIKFRRQEEAVRIHVAAARQNGAWQLSVRDNGIGIAPQFFDRIFVIFQRLHGREEYPGTGIGLAICKKIVERHGGRIWVESEPMRGSTFHFTIPDGRTDYEDRTAVSLD
jgi:signal transduction histidine kinase